MDPIKKGQLNSVALKLNARKNSRYCPHCEDVVSTTTYNKHKKRFISDTGEWIKSDKRRKIQTEHEQNSLCDAKNGEPKHITGVPPERTLHEQQTPPVRQPVSMLEPEQQPPSDERLLPEQESPSGQPPSDERLLPEQESPSGQPPSDERLLPEQESPSGQSPSDERLLPEQLPLLEPIPPMSEVRPFIFFVWPHQF